MKNHLIAASAVASFVDSVVAAYGHKVKAESTGASIAKTVAEFYATVNGDAEEFAFYFGNGLLGKKNDAGEIRRVLDARIAKLHKDKRAGIIGIIKQRLSEARKLHDLGGMPNKDEGIQAALKRYSTPAKKEAKPEGNDSHKVAIADDASMDDIADALSVWVAKHGAASAGLVAKLADFLPVSVKRSRKAA